MIARSLKRSLRAGLVGVLGLAVACGSSSPSQPPPTPSLTGDWTGTYGTRTLTMTLTSNAGSVSGGGVIVSATDGSTIDVTVTGTHNHPTVNLAFDLVAHPNAVYSGSFSNQNTVVGIVTEPAGDFALTFARQ